MGICWRLEAGLEVMWSTGIGCVSVVLVVFDLCLGCVGCVSPVFHLC